MLRFQYRGKDVDLIIDDTDKVMWLDLIIEYEDKAREKRVPMAKYPSFAYAFKQKHCELETDQDLMTMFSKLNNSNIIYI